MNGNDNDDNMMLVNNFVGYFNVKSHDIWKCDNKEGDSN